MLAILAPTAHATARTDQPAGGAVAAPTAEGGGVAAPTAEGGAVAAPTAEGSTTEGAESEPRCAVSDKLVPGCGAWFGVAASPHGNESYDQAMVNFEERIGRTVDIARYYVRAQGTLFPTPLMLDRAHEPGRERVLSINWRPTLTWRAVADGAADGYLEDLAEHIQDVYPDPFFLSLHAEMEAEVNATPGSGMTAADFRDFFRHTVTMLRSNGATSVVMVVNYMGAPHWGLVPWFETLYPGDAYVDWIAQDPFAFGEPPVFRADFAGTVDRVMPGWDWPGFYTWATTEHPGKPIMLAEWGVEEVDEAPAYKPDYFAETLEQLRDFPELKALVYWDHPGAVLVGETRVNSSAASLQQFQELVSSWELSWAGRHYLGRHPIPRDRVPAA